MPIFEFVCRTCQTGWRFSCLVGVVARAAPPVCPVCGGADLARQVSRFARARGEDEAIDGLAEQADRMDMDDPRAVGRLMREMAGELGDDRDASELEHLMEAEAEGGVAGEE